MKRHCKIRICLSLISGFIFVLMINVPCLAIQPENQKSRSGDCFQCHQDLKERSVTGSAHRAVREKRCTACHNPHAARFSHLLINKGASLCYQCHGKEKETWTGMNHVHSPIDQERCLDCHDPHVSPYRYHLKAKGQELCFRCHERQGFQMKFIHQPAGEGNCQVCHTVHASPEDSLLTGEVFRVCLNCHGQKDVSASHQGFNVTGSTCTLCHDPHSSDTVKFLYPLAHQPYRNKECFRCHRIETKTETRLIANGAKLCYTCHQEAKATFVSKSRSHLVAGENECSYCHTSHASKRKYQLRKDDQTLCLGCHPEVEVRLKAEAGKYKHPEVIKGNCSHCHDPHASSQSHFHKTDIITLCTGCHKRQKIVSHPVGDKVIDPRDKKSPITCSTCHNPMGTAFRYNLRLDGTQALCQECHHKNVE
ncbi:MAG: cytochrome c3 family protein [bacterium]